MKAVIQRVSQASVTIEGKKVSEISKGLLVLVGIEDAFGNSLRIDYTHGLPTHLHSSQTTWILGYNEQGLLSQIAQPQVVLVNLALLTH